MVNKKLTYKDIKSKLFLAKDSEDFDFIFHKVEEEKEWYAGVCGVRLAFLIFAAWGNSGDILLDFKGGHVVDFCF